MRAVGEQCPPSAPAPPPLSPGHRLTPVESAAPTRRTAPPNSSATPAPPSSTAAGPRSDPPGPSPPRPPAASGRRSRCSPAHRPSARSTAPSGGLTIPARKSFPSCSCGIQAALIRRSRSTCRHIFTGCSSQPRVDLSSKVATEPPSREPSGDRAALPHVVWQSGRHAYRLVECAVGRGPHNAQTQRGGRGVTLQARTSEVSAGASTGHFRAATNWAMHAPKQAEYRESCDGWVTPSLDCARHERDSALCCAHGCCCLAHRR
jgi:hypothetical protein